MKYGISFHIGNKSLVKYHKNLVRKVHDKFGVNHTINKSYPSHIALKYKFEKRNIKDVEIFIKEFSKNISKNKLIVGGIGKFDKSKVIFLKVKPSLEFRKMYKKFIFGLKKIKGMKWDRADKNLINNFHMTIAHKDVGEHLKEIYNFLKKYNKEFNVVFDNLTIIKKIHGKWVSHKRFNVR